MWMKKSSSNSSNALAKNQKVVEQVKKVLDKMSKEDAENYLRNCEIPAMKLTSSELKALKAGGGIIGLLWELFKPRS